jgi:hypothetical protein
VFAVGVEDVEILPVLKLGGSEFFSKLSSGYAEI